MSALVITLDPAADSDAVMASLRRVPGVELGAPMPRGMPATVDVVDATEHRRTLEGLERVPGVLVVDVVFHDHGDVAEAPRALFERRRKGADDGAA